MPDIVANDAERRERFEQTLLEALADEAAEQERQADLLFAGWESAELPEPSAAHLEAMQALLDGKHPAQKKPRRLPPLLRMAACLVLAAGVMGLAFPAQAAALISRMTAFVFERFDTHTEITVEGEGAPAEEGAVLLPSWLPEGFALDEHRPRLLGCRTTYERGGQTIRLSQMPAAGATAAVDTEDAYTERTTVGGMEALFVEKRLPQTGVTHRTLVFHSDTNLFILSADDLSRTELFKVAESLTPQPSMTAGGDAE